MMSPADMPARKSDCREHPVQIGDGQRDEHQGEPRDAAQDGWRARTAAPATRWSDVQVGGRLRLDVVHSAKARGARRLVSNRGVSRPLQSLGRRPRLAADRMTRQPDGLGRDRPDARHGGSQDGRVDRPRDRARAAHAIEIAGDDEPARASTNAT